jgi:hypothetical protein
VSAVQYATDFAALLKKGSPLPVYTLGQASVAGDSRLTNFSINFPVNAISSGGLVGLSSGNVKKNNPGANGEYRNGALTIQAIDVDGLSLDLTTGAASLESRLLWETNLYWHKE